MIQEKDFLYRVPVKTAPITTPRGQIRNPEILVDLEGGEFMHGNILDANSTNKLINQSVKDASAKVQAEQTRAEGKEKEISDKLAIVDGDSNTEGSFRKAIADVIAAAPEDLDTLKEIADKLAGNDDLHTALNQAITEKADATALEGAKTEFDEKINNLKFIPYNSIWTDDYSVQHYTLPDRKGIDLSAYTVSTKLFGDAIEIANESESLSLSRYSINIDSSGMFYVNVNSTARMTLSQDSSSITAEINDKPVIEITDATGTKNNVLELNAYGITLTNGDDNHVLTSNAGTIDITQYALKSELPTVPTKTSQLTNDSNFIAANHISDRYLGFEKDLKVYSEDSGNITTISHTGINFETDINDVAINEDGFFVSRDSDDAHLCSFTPSGIKFADKTDSDIPTANGTFINVNNFASEADVSSLRVGLSKKQDKITVNEVDTTDIEAADITKLRTIVTNLINALSASDLIRETKTLE